MKKRVTLAALLIILLSSFAVAGEMPPSYESALSYESEYQELIGKCILLSASKGKLWLNYEKRFLTRETEHYLIFSKNKKEIWIQKDSILSIDVMIDVIKPQKCE